MPPVRDWKGANQEPQIPHGDVFVEDDGATLQRYVGVIFKRRYLILGIAIVSMLAALAITLLSEPVYLARTTFEVQRDAPRVLDVGSVEADKASNDDTFQQTQFAYIKSRALAAGVVRRLHLERNQKLLGGNTASGSANGAAAQARNIEAATSIVQSQIAAAPYSQSSIIELQYRSNDPRLAAAIANAAVDEFIESSIKRQFAASNYARSFLGQRLNELKERLASSERELVNYASANRIVTVSDAKTGTAQSLDSSALTATSDKLAEARAARLLAEQSWKLASTKGGSSVAEVRNNPQIMALETQLGALEVDYRQKLKTFSPGFAPMVQLQSQIAATKAEINSVRGEIVQGLHTNFILVQNQEKALEAQMQTMTNSVLDLRNRSIQYTILQREVDTNRTLYDGLLQRYKEIGVSGGSGSNNVSIVDRARVPGVPTSPILWLNLLLALAAGLAIGFALAFVLEFIDDTIRIPDDVERKLRLPLFGITPLVDENKDIDLELADRRSSLSEAYFSVQTALQLTSATGLPRTLLVTSSSMGEGKSTTAAAIAQGIAEREKRVLLVDADLRRPTLHRRFSIPNTVGFSSLLSGAASIQDAVSHVANYGFDVIPSGPLPPNPAQLLSTTAAARVAELLAHYDIVILDGPPVLGLADAPLLAETVEASLLVVEAGKSRRGAIRNAMRRLSVGRNNLVGVVLTKFSSKTAGYGYSYTTYYYNYGNK